MIDYITICLVPYVSPNEKWLNRCHDDLIVVAPLTLAWVNFNPSMDK